MTWALAEVAGFCAEDTTEGPAKRWLIDLRDRTVPRTSRAPVALYNLLRDKFAARVSSKRRR